MGQTETLSREITDMLIGCCKSLRHKTAIVAQDRSISYGELDHKSDVVRDLLIGRGMKKRSIVAILMEDKVELVAAIVGVLKAECIFVPIDPQYPFNRIQAMALTAEPQAFLVQRKFAETAEKIVANNHSDCSMMVVDEKVGAFITQDPRRAGAPCRDAACQELPGDMGYIYFTSGSTGRPKGIAGNLRGLSHFINWEMDALGVNEDFRVSQLTPPSFDPFLRDIFLPLCAGGSLCIPPERETVLDSEKLVRWIDDSRITLIHCTPSLFRSILNQPLGPGSFHSLKYVVLAGEPLFPADIKKWFSLFDDRIQLINLYGPTETTLAKFCHFVRRSDQERRIIPVGRPIEGAEALVLTDTQELCPPGSAGEICIRTPHRSFGYYKQPELTREVFIQNPFNPDDPDDLLYRTGDFGRVLPDGALELIGRRDNQVKVRGVRVELGEIEKLLRDHQDIADAAVKDWEDDDHQKFLCAYLVSGKEPETLALRDFLSQWLPEASVPSVFIKLDELPLNLNGKIDRRALPDPRSRARKTIEYVAPRNDLERRMAEIWQAVLEAPQIGIYDTFFSLGGHSLMAIRVVARVRKEFQVEFPLRLLFEHPTVAALAEVISVEIQNKIQSDSAAEETRALGVPIELATAVNEGKSNIAC
ncbi:MAG TPA: non-ribosomal peptide synthetase [Candidatus Angelobacter sp.]